MDNHRRMVCKVNPTGGPIVLRGPPTLLNLAPSGGSPVELCAYCLEGATFEAVPNEKEVVKTDNVKKEVTTVSPNEVDLLHLNDLMLLEVEPEYIQKVELHIGGVFIADGILDREKRTVNFFKTQFDYPICAVYHHTFEVWTYHTCAEKSPKYAISGRRVAGEEDREKLKSLKINILFVYAGSDDMNVLTIKNGMAGLRYQRAIFNDTNRVCCLFTNKPESDKVYTEEGMEAWLNSNFVFAPVLPKYFQTIE
jgi:hypothetical protein